MALRSLLLPLATVALLLSTAPSARANFIVPPQLMKGAKVYDHAQIVAQTIKEAAANPKAGAEVMTYLRDPAAWQKGLNRIHAVELGLPEERIELADGIVIRTWGLPAIPAGWETHRFTAGPQPGYKISMVRDATHLYEVRIPPKLAAQVVAVHAAAAAMKQLQARNVGRGRPSR